MGITPCCQIRGRVAMGTDAAGKAAFRNPSPVPALQRSGDPGLYRRSDQAIPDRGLDFAAMEPEVLEIGWSNASV